MLLFLCIPSSAVNMKGFLWSCHYLITRTYQLKVLQFHTKDVQNLTSIEFNLQVKLSNQPLRNIILSFIFWGTDLNNSVKIWRATRTAQKLGEKNPYKLRKDLRDVTLPTCLCVYWATCINIFCLYWPAL